jgi:polyisoprenoid-binding protein YceI
MSPTTRTTATPAVAARLADGSWRLDPARSSVVFHVRHFYGLMTVKGEFADYDGTLDLGAAPAVELTIQAISLDTKLAKRDEHLRSKDFFDVARHPQVRFISDRGAFDATRCASTASFTPPAARSRWSSTRPCARSTASWRSRPSRKPTTASWA